MLFRSNIISRWILKAAARRRARTPNNVESEPMQLILLAEKEELRPNVGAVAVPHCVNVVVVVETHSDEAHVLAPLLVVRKLAGSRRWGRRVAGRGAVLEIQLSPSTLQPKLVCVATSRANVARVHEIGRYAEHLVPIDDVWVVARILPVIVWVLEVCCEEVASQRLQDN